MCRLSLVVKPCDQSLFRLSNMDLLSYTYGPGGGLGKVSNITVAV